MRRRRRRHYVDRVAQALVSLGHPACIRRSALALVTISATPRHRGSTRRASQRCRNPAHNERPASTVTCCRRARARQCLIRGAPPSRDRDATRRITASESSGPASSPTTSSATGLLYARPIAIGGRGGAPRVAANTDEARIPQTWVVGNADHCVAELARFIREYGITDLVTWAMPPGMRPERMNGSLERFFRNVVPRLKAAVAAF